MTANEIAAAATEIAAYALYTYHDYETNCTMWVFWDDADACDENAVFGAVIHLTAEQVLADQQRWDAMTILA